MVYLPAAKVERPMALNLANEDDGGSQNEIPQKDNASNAGQLFLKKCCCQVFHYIYCLCLR